MKTTTTAEAKPAAATTEKPVETRTRTRSSETKPKKTSKLVQSQMEELAQTTYLQNKKMNTAKSGYDSARKALLASMEAQGMKEFRFTGVDEEGKEIILEAKVDSPPTSYISVEKLRQLVNDDDTFMKIVEASKKSVEAHVGGIIATQATVASTGTKNVYVAPAGSK